MWGERQDLEINKPEKGCKTGSRQNGHLINHCIPETIKFDFRVILLRRIKSDGQEISTIEWQELKNLLPSFLVHK